MILPSVSNLATKRIRAPWCGKNYSTGWRWVNSDIEVAPKRHRPGSRRLRSGDSQEAQAAIQGDNTTLLRLAEPMLNQITLTTREFRGERGNPGIRAGRIKFFSVEVFSKSVRARWQSFGAFQLDDLLDTNFGMDPVPGQCVGFCQGRILFGISLALSSGKYSKATIRYEFVYEGGEKPGGGSTGKIGKVTIDLK
jgi:hypothetical protein